MMNVSVFLFLCLGMACSAFQHQSNHHHHHYKLRSIIIPSSSLSFHWTEEPTAFGKQYRTSASSLSTTTKLYAKPDIIPGTTSGDDEFSIRALYEKWKEQHGKSSSSSSGRNYFDARRYEIFKGNYLASRQAHEAATRRAHQESRPPPGPLVLNAFADLTPQEFRQLQEQTQGGGTSSVRSSNPSGRTGGISSPHFFTGQQQQQQQLLLQTTNWEDVKTTSIDPNQQQRQGVESTDLSSGRQSNTNGTKGKGNGEGVAATASGGGFYVSWDCLKDQAKGATQEERIATIYQDYCHHFGKVPTRIDLFTQRLYMFLRVQRDCYVKGKPPITMNSYADLTMEEFQLAQQRDAQRFAAQLDQQQQRQQQQKEDPHQAETPTDPPLAVSSYQNSNGPTTNQNQVDSPKSSTVPSKKSPPPPTPTQPMDVDPSTKWDRVAPSSELSNTSANDKKSYSTPPTSRTTESTQDDRDTTLSSFKCDRVVPSSGMSTSSIQEDVNSSLTAPMPFNNNDSGGGAAVVENDDMDNHHHEVPPQDPTNPQDELSQRALLEDRMAQDAYTKLIQQAREEEERMNWAAALQQEQQSKEQELFHRSLLEYTTKNGIVELEQRQLEQEGQEKERRRYEMKKQAEQQLIEQQKMESQRDQALPIESKKDEVEGDQQQLQLEQEAPEKQRRRNEMKKQAQQQLEQQQNNQFQQEEDLQKERLGTEPEQQEERKQQQKRSLDALEDAAARQRAWKASKAKLDTKQSDDRKHQRGALDEIDSADRSSLEQSLDKDAAKIFLSNTNYQVVPNDEPVLDVGSSVGENKRDAQVLEKKAAEETAAKQRAELEKLRQEEMAQLAAEKEAIARAREEVEGLAVEVRKQQKELREAERARKEAEKTQAEELRRQELERRRLEDEEKARKLESLQKVEREYEELAKLQTKAEKKYLRESELRKAAEAKREEERIAREKALETANQNAMEVTRAKKEAESIRIKAEREAELRTQAESLRLQQEAARLEIENAQRQIEEEAKIIEEKRKAERNGRNKAESKVRRKAAEVAKLREIEASLVAQNKEAKLEVEKAKAEAQSEAARRQIEIESFREEQTRLLAQVEAAQRQAESARQLAEAEAALKAQEMEALKGDIARQVEESRRKIEEEARERVTAELQEREVSRRQEIFQRKLLKKAAQYSSGIAEARRELDELAKVKNEARQAAVSRKTRTMRNNEASIDRRVIEIEQRRREMARAQRISDRTMFSDTLAKGVEDVDEVVRSRIQRNRWARKKQAEEARLFQEAQSIVQEEASRKDDVFRRSLLSSQLKNTAMSSQLAKEREEALRVEEARRVAQEQVARKDDVFRRSLLSSQLKNTAMSSHLAKEREEARRAEKARRVAQEEAARRDGIFRRSLLSSQLKNTAITSQHARKREEERRAEEAQRRVELFRRSLLFSQLSNARIPSKRGQESANFKRVDQMRFEAAGEGQMPQRRLERGFKRRRIGREENRKTAVEAQRHYESALIQDALMTSMNEVDQLASQRRQRFGSAQRRQDALNQSMDDSLQLGVGNSSLADLRLQELEERLRNEEDERLRSALRRIEETLRAEVANDNHSIESPDTENVPPKDGYMEYMEVTSTSGPQIVETSRPDFIEEDIEGKVESTDIQESTENEQDERLRNAARRLEDTLPSEVLGANMQAESLAPTDEYMESASDRTTSFDLDSSDSNDPVSSYKEDFQRRLMADRFALVKRRDDDMIDNGKIDTQAMEPEEGRAEKGHAPSDVLPEPTLGLSTLDSGMDERQSDSGELISTDESSNVEYPDSHLQGSPTISDTEEIDIDERESVTVELTSNVALNYAENVQSYMQESALAVSEMGASESDLNVKDNGSEEKVTKLTSDGKPQTGMATSDSQSSVSISKNDQLLSLLSEDLLEEELAELSSILPEMDEIVNCASNQSNSTDTASDDGQFLSRLLSEDLLEDELAELSSILPELNDFVNTANNNSIANNAPVSANVEKGQSTSFSSALLSNVVGPPSLETVRRISGVLSSISDKVTKLGKQSELPKSQVQAIDTPEQITTAENPLSLLRDTETETGTKDDDKRSDPESKSAASADVAEASRAQLGSTSSPAVKSVFDQLASLIKPKTTSKSLDNTSQDEHTLEVDDDSTVEPSAPIPRRPKQEPSMKKLLSATAGASWLGRSSETDTSEIILDDDDDDAEEGHANGNELEGTAATEVEQDPPKRQQPIRIQDLPTLSDWYQNPDDSIVGVIGNSADFATGTEIWTAPVVETSTEMLNFGRRATVVTTVSGSRYRLIGPKTATDARATIPLNVKSASAFKGGSPLDIAPGYEFEEEQVEDEGARLTPVFSLSSLLGGTKPAAPPETGTETPPTEEASTPSQSKAPDMFSFFGKKKSGRTMAILTDWEQNQDGSITGVVSNREGFEDGTWITTSPVKTRAKAGRIVTTEGGTRYRLS